MVSLKIWPWVLFIWLSIQNQEPLFLSALHIPDNSNVNVGPFLAGNVGCLISDVCLPTEICKNDEVFGKCIDEDFSTSETTISFAERSLLKNLRKDFLRIGMDFHDYYVQCVFRSLILKFRMQNEEIDIVEICGALPTEVSDYYQEDKRTFEPQMSFGRKRRFKKMFPSEIDVDRIRKFIHHGNPTYNSEFNLVQDHTDLLSKKSLNILDLDHRIPFDKLIAEINSDLLKNHVPSSLTRRLTPWKTIPTKRFNREKVVKVGTAEFDRRTKNTIWLRLNKSVNYIEAEDLLRELSDDLEIRPPIAQFQLDKTGRVLIFFVPFETDLVASDVTSLMSRNPTWLKLNRIYDIGIGMPILTESIAAPHTVTKTNQLAGGPGSGDDDGDEEEEGGTYAKSNPHNAESKGQGHRVSYTGFVTLAVISSLAVATAILLFVLNLVCRRVRLDGLHSDTRGEGSRKASDRPLLSASPSRKTSLHKESVEKTPQQQSSTSSADSPTPYRESTFQEVKQGVFRQPLVSTGGSEASTESMAAASNSRTAHINSSSLWDEEPVPNTLDVTTGHLILSYMEEHLRNRNRLEADWRSVNAYESEEAIPCECARRPENIFKNRQGCPIPYEQTRVMLSCRGDNYINASLMYDHDPRNPSYIATATPLLVTVADFWQMVWEQFAVVIVCLEPESSLTQVVEDPFNMTYRPGDDVVSQARYWPPEGAMVFGKFEVRLVSEHRLCGDYVTRSFYLKERDSNETRTVTQFHFLNWLKDVPSCGAKTLLEFRRKVNRSFRAKKSPVVIHCNDGSSKTGAYLLLDLVLNRISKGVKELDVAASLEHLRDQRQGMVKSKTQFEFVLVAIAEEVNMMLNCPSSVAP